MVRVRATVISKAERPRLSRPQWMSGTREEEPMAEIAQSSRPGIPSRSAARHADGPLRPVTNPRGWVVYGASALIVVLLFGLTLARTGWLNSAETSALQWISAHHVAWLDATALAIAWLLSPTQGVVIVVFGGVIVLIVTNNVRRAVLFLVIGGVGSGACEIVKEIVRRPRPDYGLLAHPLGIEHSFSYPSGHTCLIVGLSLAVIITARNSRWRPTLIVTGAVATLLVALSRLYLGVHHPSDVIAAILTVTGTVALVAPLMLNVILPRTAPRPRRARVDH